MDGKVKRPAAFALSPALPPQKVVLKVDASRQIDYRRWLLLGLLLLAAALFNGSQRSAPLSHGYRIVELQRLRAEEEARGRRLRREIAALASPAVIDRFAREQLHMVLPGPDDQIVLTLVVPPSRRRRPSSRHARRSHVAAFGTSQLAADGRTSPVDRRACCSASGPSRCSCASSICRSSSTRRWRREGSASRRASWTAGPARRHRRSARQAPRLHRGGRHARRGSARTREPARRRSRASVTLSGTARPTNGPVWRRGSVSRPAGTRRVREWVSEEQARRVAALEKTPGGRVAKKPGVRVEKMPGVRLEKKPRRYLPEQGAGGQRPGIRRRRQQGDCRARAAV